MAQPMVPNIEQLERTVALYRGLVEVSVLINSISDFEELLSQVLDVAGRVMRAEASSLFLIDETNGDLELAIARGPVGTEPPRKAKVPRGHGFVGWVREHRKSLLVTDAYQDPRFYSDLDKTSGFITRSLLCVPLLQGEQELGVLEVLNPIDKDHFDPVDLEAFEVYGSLAATAIARVRAVEQERQRRELERDLSLATEIQHSFLPRRLPVTGRVAFAAHYRPAREIAGDFYDVFALDDETFDFVIGDVSGKGVSAALMMAQAVSMLRLIVHSENSPGVSMRRWNDWLCGRTIRGLFITAVLGRITPRTGLLEFAVAGHSGPLVRQADEKIEEPAIESAAPLGILRNLSFSVNQIHLSPQSQAIFYTDGLMESFDAERKSFSASRVRRVLSQSFADENGMVKALLEAERAHRGEIPPHDDLTILVIGLK